MQRLENPGESAKPATGPGTGGLPEHRSIRQGAAWLLPPLVALLVSWNTVPGSFIFDDTLIVEGDERLRDFDLHRIFRENWWGTARPSSNWRPVTLFTFALNHQLSSSPWCFHLVNVALNAAVAAVAFLVFSNICRSRWGAAAGAAVFAALPIHCEAVANVVGRAELLAALFALWAWNLSLKGPGSWRRSLAIGGLVLTGTLSKENAAVTAFLIPASALVLRRSFPWRPTLFAVLGVLAYFLLYGLLLVDAPVGSQGAARIDNPLAREPALTRAVNGVLLLGHYVLRTAVPLHLAADHSYNQLPVMPLSEPALWWQAGLALLVLVVPAAVAARRAPVVALGFLAFPLAFAATSNILFPIGTIFAERIAFLPSVGYALAVAGGLDLLRERGPAGRRAAFLVAVALIVAYGGRAWLRNRVWADPVTFGLRLALDSSGSARAHLKAGESRLLLAGRATGEAGRQEELRLAEAELRAAAAIKEDEVFGHRAMLRVEEERYPEALQDLQRARESYRRDRIELDPQVVFLEARVLFLLGRLPDALRSLDEYLRRRRQTPTAALHLRGQCRMGVGQLAEAEPDLEEAVRRDPDRGEYRMDRGILLAQLGRTGEAREELDRAVSLSPENPQVYTNRGYLRFLAGDQAGALADYRKGLELCERKGRLTALRGESILGFRRKIFDLHLRAGDLAAAERELEAVRAIQHPAAAAAARELEAQLSSRR